MQESLEGMLLGLIARKLSVSESDLVEAAGGKDEKERVREALHKLEKMELVQHTEDPITNRPLYSPTTRGMMQTRQKSSKAIL